MKESPVEEVRHVVLSLNTSFRITSRRFVSWQGEEPFPDEQPFAVGGQHQRADVVQGLEESSRGRHFVCSSGGEASQISWIVSHDSRMIANRTNWLMRIGSYRSASANLVWTCAISQAAAGRPAWASRRASDAEDSGHAPEIRQERIDLQTIGVIAFESARRTPGPLLHDVQGLGDYVPPEQFLEFCELVGFERIIKKRLRRGRSRSRAGPCFSGRSLSLGQARP